VQVVTQKLKEMNGFINIDHDPTLTLEGLVSEQGTQKFAALVYGLRSWSEAERLN